MNNRKLALIALFLVAVFVIGDILSVAIGIGSVALPASNTCTSTNGFCLGQIAFHTTVFGNASASTTGIITTGSWTTFLNETMVVVPSVGASFFPSQVSTVKDTLGDIFTRQILQFYAIGSPDFNELEVWTGKTVSSGLNAITVTWNTTLNPILLVQAAMYQGVASVGAKLSTTGLGATGNTISIITVKSGSWIFGVSSIGVAIPPCNTIVSSPLFVRRLDGCAQNGSLGVETELSDNSTQLRNIFSLSYAPTWSPAAFFEQALVELVPQDVEPNTPDFTTFCTVNSACCTSQSGSVCVAPVTVQILFLPVISARSTTAFTTIMYATPIAPPVSITATFQWLAHNATFAFTESGGNTCTIAASAFSCSVVTTFPTVFIGTPNVVATSTTPSRTQLLP